MGNFTTVPDVVAGQSFPPSLWESAIMNNLNLGVCRQLGDVTLGGSAATIAFSSIPATFAHLMLVVYARGDVAATFTNVNLRFNGDTGADYDIENLTANSTTVSALGTASGAATSGLAARVPGSTAPASAFSAGLIWIPHYTNTVGHKPWLSLSHDRETSGGVSDNVLALFAGIWFAAAAAINNVTLLPSSGNFVTGSRVTLYGLPS